MAREETGERKRKVMREGAEGREERGEAEGVQRKLKNARSITSSHSLERACRFLPSIPNVCIRSNNACACVQIATCRLDYFDVSSSVLRICD